MRLILFTVCLLYFAAAHAAGVGFSPLSIMFPGQLVGTTSATQYVTVSNQSASIIYFTAITAITGDFASAGTGTCYKSLNPGTSCNMSVKFKPTAAGTRTGTLTVYTSIATQNIALSGTGLTSTSASPTPNPSPSPTPVPVTSSSSPYSGLKLTSTGLNYYVSTTGSDSGSGSASSPWKTLQHAASVINALSSVSTGVTVHVAPGSYSGAVSVSKSGASAAAPVRFISDTRWGAKLSTGSTDPGWKMAGNYQEVVGFDMNGTGNHGILFTGSFDRVLANKVHGYGANACNSSGGAAMDTGSYTNHDIEMSNNVIFSIGPGGGKTFCSTVQGIYPAIPYEKIFNNLISTVSGGCISSWHGASHLTIIGNTVVNCMGQGILIGCGDANCVINDYDVVANNIAAYNKKAGIQEATYTTPGTHNVYYNNLLWGNSSNSVITQSSQEVVSGTIVADPKFVNYTGDVSTGDYHLLSNSPAINKGTTESIAPYDIDSYPRASGTFDIGAYEWH